MATTFPWRVRKAANRLSFACDDALPGLRFIAPAALAYGFGLEKRQPFLCKLNRGPRPLSVENRYVKLIIAIIQPARLEAVKAALTDVEVFRLTVMDVQGFGRQKGHTEVYRGHEFTVNLLRKVELQIAVNDEFVQPTVDAIIRGGRTGEKGEIGDGKIFILPLEDCIRIRTGERGKEAI